MNVDGDIVDGGCYEAIRKKGFGRDADEGNGVMNEGDQSSTTRVTRTVLTDRGVVLVHRP